jgi:diadenosine tetraphosphate (Ap4A) HIT family hydrolase
LLFYSLFLVQTTSKKKKKGHVLLIPKRKVERFNELSQEELFDLFDSVQKVSKAFEREWKPSAFTFAVQDGEAAGQTIRHVHVHVMPRHVGDFKVSDQIYSEIEKPRTRRSEEEMAEEAKTLSSYFPENQDQFSFD